MRRVKAWALLSAAGMASAVPAMAQQAQQVGPSGPATRVVVFGDSLADGGFYLTIDPRIPREAGSFTTNPDPVAPEVMAAQLGLPLLPVYGQGGTNYAVGGARVTAANGLAIPVATQISTFLSANSTIRATDLFYVQGGGNDYFTFLAGGGRDPTILSTAATQLAQQVTRLQAAGARRIVTLSVQSAGAAPVQAFNTTFKAALASAGANVLFVDVDRLFNEILTNPGQFGITNTTQNACIGSSLSCTRATLVTPNANLTYARADDVHPTGIVQQVQGQLIASLIIAPEQIGGLAFASQAAFRSQRDQLAPVMQAGLPDGGGGLFGSVGYAYAARAGNAQSTGFDERAPVPSGRWAPSVKTGAGVGIAGAYGDGRGNFGGAGGYRANRYSVTGYGHVSAGLLRVAVDGTYGKVDYRGIARAVVMGPSLRRSNGNTDGDYVAVRGSIGAVVLVGGLGLGPEAALQYERIGVDGFTESGTASSDATFGAQRLRSLTGRFGVLAQTPVAAPVQVVARAAYVREFETEVPRIAITPSGAPVAYTTELTPLDRNYWTGGLAVEGRVGTRIALRGGVTTEVGRGDLDRVAAHAGVTLAF